MICDYSEESEGWGKKALWLLLGVSVPVVVWLLTRGKDDSSSNEVRREPETAEKPVADAPEVVVAPAPEPEPEPELKEADPIVVEAPVVVEPEVEVVESVACVAGEWKIPIQLEDGEKISHAAELLSLDPAAKRAEVKSEKELAVKDKVRLKIPCENGGAALTLAATVQQVGEGRTVLKLFAINAALKERVEKFVDSQASAGE